MENKEKTAMEKGNELEQAVEAIERTILSVAPLASDKTFVVESKKIITIDGVRHEIDIYVTIDLGHYKSVYIFECKNWAEAVGKNEIIVFSEKIRVSGATNGFFIAKSFTADAEAQAKRDDRMRLLIATEHAPFATVVPFDFHILVNEIVSVRIRLEKVGTTGTTIERLPEDVSAEHNGKTAPLKEFAGIWAEQMTAEHSGKFNSHTLPAADYSNTVEGERTFSPGELVVNGTPIEKAHLTVAVKSRIVRLAVVSHFEIESRGRCYILAPVDVLGSSVEMGITQVALPKTT